MITKEKLLKCLTDESFFIYESLATDNIGTIELTSLEILIDFAKKHSVDTFFYHYTYADEDDLLIDEDVISELRLDSEALYILEDKFEEYNSNVEMLDFTKPIFLNVYCVFQGVAYSVEEKDYWFIGEGFEMPETAALEIATRYLDDIADTKKANAEKIYKEREVLKRQILNDKEFHACTNATLRRGYADKLCRGNKYIRDLFWLERGGLRDITFLAFIEQIWKEYKQSI